MGTLKLNRYGWYGIMLAQIITEILWLTVRKKLKLKCLIWYCIIYMLIHQLQELTYFSKGLLWWKLWPANSTF